MSKPGLLNESFDRAMKALRRKRPSAPKHFQLEWKFKDGFEGGRPFDGKIDAAIEEAKARLAQTPTMVHVAIHSRSKHGAGKISGSDALATVRRSENGKEIVVSRWDAASRPTKTEYHVHEGRPSWHQSRAGGISGGAMIFATRAEAEAFVERVKKLRPNEPVFIQEVKKS